MKKILLQIIFFAAVLSSLGANAQRIDVIEDIKAEKFAIVRQFDESRSIYYIEETNQNKHFFVLQDYTNPGSVIMAEFPSYMNVHDFEIYDEVVYFCGQFPNSGNPWGMVGFIHIHDLFFNNAPYTFGIINTLSYGTIYNGTQLTSADRMDIYNDGGLIHFAVVGTLNDPVVSHHPIYNTVCDIWFDGSQWLTRALGQKEYFYSFTDITCTDNHVAVAAIDAEINKPALIVFDKVPPFVQNPTYGNSFIIDDELRGGSVLIERLQDNDIAMAYYYENPTSNYGTSLLYTNSIGNLLPVSSIIYNVYHFSHNSNTLMNDPVDMRYDQNADKIALLHDIESPIWANTKPTVFEYDGYNLSGLIARAWIPSIDAMVYSVDNRIYNQYRSLTGLDNEEHPILSINQNDDEACFIVKPFEYEDYTPYIRITSGRLEIPVLNGTHPSYTIFYPNPETIPTVTLCE